MASRKPATTPTLRVGVSDFGPIVRGNVTLRPLTVFVGPNNSGKSYLAMLLYSLWHSFSPRVVYAAHTGRAGIRRIRGRDVPLVPLTYDDYKRVSPSLTAWLEKLSPSNAMGHLRLSSLPLDVHRTIERGMRAAAKQMTANLGSELRRCFGTELSNLARVGARTKRFRVSMNQAEPTCRIQFIATEDDIKATLLALDVANAPLDRDYLLRFRGRRHVVAVEGKIIQPEALSAVLFMVSDALYGPLLADTYYFPAARSGILQSHRAVASLVVSRSPLVGIEEPLDIPRFTGVVTDFMSALLMMEKENGRPLAKVASFLEQNVTGGSITMEVGRLEYPEIYYEPLAGGRFPLRSTSSMVSELAPVVLFLKYIIDPQDFLIIEEPESHLHPDNQRRLARGLVKLVRSGVRVLVTTHSDFFLSQLTNFIHLSLLSPEDRAAHGYDPDDYLNAQDVGAYLFKCVPEQGGSFIKRLNITSREGIPQQELSKVSQALYEESVRLERELLK